MLFSRGTPKKRGLETTASFASPNIHYCAEKKGLIINNYLFSKKITDLKGFLNIKPRNPKLKKKPELEPCVMLASVPPELEVKLIKQQSTDPLKAITLKSRYLNFIVFMYQRKSFQT